MVTDHLFLLAALKTCKFSALPASQQIQYFGNCMAVHILWLNVGGAYIPIDGDHGNRNTLIR